MAQFEGKERRMPKIEACLSENGFASLEEARELCGVLGGCLRTADYWDWTPETLAAALGSL